MLSKSSQPSVFLLGFVPFFRKELQEWKRKQSAIAVLLLIPLTLGIIAVVLTKIAATSNPTLGAQGIILLLEALL